MEVGNNKESGGAGDPPRQRFYIELKPGETTVVSWKKLLKDAAAKNANAAQSSNQITAAAATVTAVMEPASVDTAQKESQFALGQPTESLPKKTPSSRLGSVIEKIERLYVGNQSDDEEEYDGVPDEDQYDTGDSFIDDTELDEYFEVDESTTKHNGFFVNKGKLEHMNEPISPILCQLKKKKKSTRKDREEKNDDHVRIKQAKSGRVRRNAATRKKPLVEPLSTNPQSLAAQGDHHDGKLHSSSSPIGSADKKTASFNVRSENLSHSGSMTRDDSISKIRLDYSEKQMAGIFQSRHLDKIVKDTSEFSEIAYQENNVPDHLALQSKRSMSEITDAECSSKVSHRNKKGRYELPDLNLPHYPELVEKVETASTDPKDVSSLQHKDSLLERAIRDLEKAVAECRPQNIEVQNAFTSSTTVERRLPPDVGQKLAKVARLGQSNQGMISEELINRLMGILGHSIQLRTLKKKLRELVEMGLSSKQEKADKFQQIKEEVMEMILQASTQRDKAVDEFQKALIHKEKGAVNGKYSMESKIEDKLCDLYDLYVQGIDEDKGDKGPRIRKLYSELAELWSEGAMNSHGIKNAICRAKERKRAFYSNEKARGKTRMEELSRKWRENNVSGKATAVARAKLGEEELAASAAIVQYLSGHASTLPPFLRSHNDGSQKQDKLEKMTFPMLKEQMKPQSQELDGGLKRSSPKADRESYKSHIQDVGKEDGLKHHFTSFHPGYGQH